MARLPAASSPQLLRAEDGSPLQLWRGETSGLHFERFERRKTRSDCFFFATDRRQAASYAACGGLPERAFTLSATRVLDLRDPCAPVNRAFVRALLERFAEWIDRESGEEYDLWLHLEAGDLYNYECTGSGERWLALFALAEEMGYDAVIVHDVTDGVSAPVVVVFEPWQIHFAAEAAATQQEEAYA